MGFVFAALLEFAVAVYLSNLHNTVIDNETKKGAEKILWRKRYYGNLFARKVKPNSFSMKSGPGKQYHHNSKNQKCLDNISSIVFGISFVLFNLIYWLRYFN